MIEKNITPTGFDSLNIYNSINISSLRDYNDFKIREGYFFEFDNFSTIFLEINYLTILKIYFGHY